MPSSARVALITGCGKPVGIGNSTARALASAGVAVIVSDVVSTGVIENYLLAQLRLKKPAQLKLVALLDRTDLRTVDISPDYSAFKVDHGGSFVGYGLELEGKHGNLPWIGRM